MIARAFLLLCVGLVIGGVVFAGCKDKEPTKPPPEETKKAEGKPETPPAPEQPPAMKKPAEPAEPPAPEKPPVPEKTAEPEKPPAPEAPATTGREKSPWHDAKVGDTVKYKTMGDMMQIWEVVRVDDEFAHVKMTMEVGGTEMPATEQKMPRFATAGAAPPVKAGGEMKDLGTETLEVAGMKLECKVMEMKIKMGDKTATTKTWICEEIPGGMVKSMSDAMGPMQVIMELVEFKRGN